MKKFIEGLIGGKFTLRRKLILLYFLSAVLPILTITILTSAFYYRSSLENAYDLVEQNMRQQEIIVNERLDSYDDVLYELAADQTYIELAEIINGDNENLRLASKNTMKQMFRNSLYSYNQIKSVTFIADNGEYTSSSYGSFYDNTWSATEKGREIYNKINENQKISFTGMVNLMEDIGLEDYVVLMGLPVRNLRTKEQSGVFVLALSKEVFMLESKEQDWKSSAVRTVMVDETDKILAIDNISYINHSLEELVEKEYAGVERVAIRRHQLEGHEWEVVSIINLSIYEKEIAAMMKIVILLIIIITCIFFFIVFIFTRKYIQNVQNIAKGIQSYKGVGNQKIEVDVDEKDELYIIVRQFYTMTARINSLVEDIQRASMRQKHAEIKALEAQINPHFLYNTLDSINWRAIENDEEEISNMLGALGSLLRYTVSNIDMVVVMAAEISWLKKYIFLQRDRFHNSFDCQYDIAEDVMSFPIYKMLLQPIIENSILHAFQDVNEGGMIYVTAYVRKDDKMVIKIRDNGSGMSEEVLGEIKEEIRNSNALNSRSIGISNIINRLKLYYQDEAELKVNSKLGEGTEFILIIPRKDTEEFL